MDAIAKMPTYEAYKDSGYEWIGNVPSSWDISKLGSCLFPVSIKNHPDYPLLSITREQGVIQRDVENQDSNHNYIPDDLSGYKLLKEGQFGMNKMKAWQGSYGVSSFTGIVSPAYFVFDFIKPISPSFFNWAIRSKLYVSFFGSASDGVRVGQWDLSKSRMKIIPFLIPSTEEQTLIANFLDQKSAQIDEAIAIKEQQIALLKERKQIIIQKAVTQGLDPDVPMKDSGVDWIGQIPEHWMTTKAKFYSTIFVPERAKPSLNEIGDGYLWVTTNDLRNNYSVVEKTKLFVSRREAKKTGSRVVEKNSVLATCVGTFGVAAINLQECIVNQQIQAYTSLKINAFYLKKLVEISEDYFSNNATMTTIAYVNRNVFADFPVVVPPKDEQLKIIDQIQKLSESTEQAITLFQNQIAKLKEYKTTLINSAVTGKIRITPEMVA